MHDKEEYVIHIRNLKQALDHGLVLKKVYRVIKFNVLYMNTELRAKADNDFEKDFFKLRNSAVFGKTMENARKPRGVKLVTTEKRRY